MENQTFTYWGNKGKYQKQHDIMWELVPQSGEVEIPQNKRLEDAIESVRQMARLYYDFYNNGCCNVIETKNEDCYECNGNGWEDDTDEDCCYCGGSGEVESCEGSISEYYEPMVRNLENLTMMNISNVLKRCGSNYGRYDFPDKDCIILEKFADKVFELAWNVYKDEDIKKKAKTIKSLYNRKHKTIKVNDFQIFYDWCLYEDDKIDKMKVSECVDNFKEYVITNNLNK